MSATDSLHQRGARHVPEIAGDICLERLHRYLLARELAQSKTVLNIACGAGEGANLLAAVAHSVIAVDPAPDVIDRALRRHRRSNLTFRCGASTAVPVMDESIELLVCFETIECDTQHARILAEMRRVLAPGGVLILSTIDREVSAAAGRHSPFHVGALNREELEQLLHSHFSYVALAGQWLRAGSIVGPLEGQTYPRFLTFREEDQEVDRVVGIGPPQHLIALASNAPIPAVPIGLMDGGDFAWADRPPATPVEPRIDETADALARRVADLARQHARDRQRLIDIRALTARLHAAIDRHREDSLSAWDQARAHEARIADLERRHLVELETQRAAHEHRLAEVEHEATNRWVAAEGLGTAVKALEADIASMHGAMGAERDNWRAREVHLLALIEQMSAAAAAHQTTMAAMERSHSWRITRPLRSARRFVSKMAAHAGVSRLGGVVR